MAVRAYTTGNYFRLNVDGEPLIRQDVKSSVKVYELDTDVFIIKSPQIGEVEVSLSDLQDESGTPYDSSTWEAFYTSETGFNPAGGGSSANLLTGWTSYIDTQYPNSGAAFTLPANTDTVIPNNAGIIIQGQKPGDIETFYFHKKINITSVSGSFENLETITGSTSGATGNIIFANESYILLSSVVGTFVDTETVTGGTSGATASVSGAQIDSKIPGRNGDSLDAMVYFRAVPSSANQWLDIWIDIGGGIGELYRDTKSFPKGSGTERGIIYGLPSGYTADTWEANGGTLYMRSNAILDLYGINFNFDRTHKGIV